MQLYRILRQINKARGQCLLQGYDEIHRIRITYKGNMVMETYVTDLCEISNQAEVEKIRILESYSMGGECDKTA